MSYRFSPHGLLVLLIASGVAFPLANLFDDASASAIRRFLPFSEASAPYAKYGSIDLNLPHTLMIKLRDQSGHSIDEFSLQDFVRVRMGDRPHWWRIFFTLSWYEAAVSERPSAQSRIATSYCRWFQIDQPAVATIDITFVLQQRTFERSIACASISR